MILAKKVILFQKEFIRRINGVSDCPNKRKRNKMPEIRHYLFFFKKAMLYIFLATISSQLNPAAVCLEPNVAIGKNPLRACHECAKTSGATGNGWGTASRSYKIQGGKISGMRKTTKLEGDY